jgi:hypothetical protein
LVEERRGVILLAETMNSIDSMDLIDLMDLMDLTELMDSVLVAFGELAGSVEGKKAKKAGARSESVTRSGDTDADSNADTDDRAGFRRART